jgi:gamma-glutamylaminecyclotransferase
MAPRRRLLFVYGTLMRGEPNHPLLAGASFHGPGRTLPRFELVDLDAYPAMVSGGTAAVAGELYEVDEAVLAAVDDLEGHPRLYRRRRVALAGGGRAEAYLMAREATAGLPRIPSGDWRRK